MPTSKRAMRSVIALLCVILASGFVMADITALAGTAVRQIIAANAPPIAENLEFTTFKDIAITEKFKATDTDGDTLTFEITAPPKKGEAVVSTEGVFVYTPKEGYKGKDSFCYVAVDSVGNVSAEATVKVSVKKQSSKTTYSDMKGSSAAFAAVSLSEKGIFTGESLGGEYFFRPEQSVTRGEFLAMCLKACETETLEGITRTGFYDDDSIPLWVKPYVSTALMNGYIGGYKNADGRLVFSPNEPITFSEASVILNNILNITDVVSVAAVETDDDMPVWAYTATANLAACNIFPDDVSDIYNTAVTRADAARMLLASTQLLESRDGGKSLLGWAK